MFSFLLRMKAVLVLLSFLVASCASQQIRGRTSLVGDWRYADATQSCHYSFKKDGTFTGEVTYRTRVISKFSGNWAVNGDVLLYTYVSDVLGRIPAGATDRDKLLEVKKNSFLINAADGSRRRYLRLLSTPPAGNSLYSRRISKDKASQ
ncbi:MAG: hypothetical protein QOG67_1472 [Verrucomicrobiota bacterium]|jgi:hypothetical protein